MAVLALRENEDPSRGESALLELQYRLAARSPVSAEDIRSAVAADAAALRSMSLVVLTKLLDSTAIPLEHADITAIGGLIRDEMVKLPLAEPELFLNYAQAAVICVKSASKRDT